MHKLAFSRCCAAACCALLLSAASLAKEPAGGSKPAPSNAGAQADPCASGAPVRLNLVLFESSGGGPKALLADLALQGRYGCALEASFSGQKPAMGASPAASETFIASLRPEKKESFRFASVALAFERTGFAAANAAFPNAVMYPASAALYADALAPDSRSKSAEFGCFGKTCGLLIVYADEGAEGGPPRERPAKPGGAPFAKDPFSLRSP